MAGYCAKELHRYEEGTGFLECALQLEPTNAYAHSELALVQMHDERFAEAADSLTRAFRMNPKLEDQERWLSTMGYIRSKKGDWEVSANSYSAAVQMEPRCHATILKVSSSFSDREMRRSDERVSLMRELKDAEAFSARWVYDELSRKRTGLWPIGPQS